MARGEKIFESVQASGGWQMLEKSCREACGPFRPTGVRSPQLASGRLCLTCTRDKDPNPSEGNTQRALGRAGPPPLVGVVSKEALHSLLPIPLLPPGRQGAQWPATAFSLAGDACGEGNFSAEAELLRADCR